ncbi:uncharacterized protein Tco_1233147 [Tanacetum coccineum]
MSHMNSILDMIRNEDFDTLSRFAVVNNEMNSESDDVDEVQRDGIGDETKALNEDVDEIVNEFHVPSNFTNIEEIDMTTNESYNSWYWFLSHVKRHVVKEREGICLISDRHPGILKVVNEEGSPWLEPRGFHRYCLRHFINNFNDKFHNSQLKTLAYRAGSQNQVRKFNSIMEEIGQINPQARQWLQRHAFDRWTLAHDGGKRYGLLTTNLSEIFHNCLKELSLHFIRITRCVQLTFYRLVHYFDVRRPQGIHAQSNGERYAPHVVAKQEALKLKASAHSVRSFNWERGIFEIDCGGKNFYFKQ